MPNMTFDQYLKEQFIRDIGGGVSSSSGSPGTDEWGNPNYSWGGAYTLPGINSRTYTEAKQRAEMSGQSFPDFQTWADQLAQRQYSNWIMQKYGSAQPWADGNQLYQQELNQFKQDQQAAVEREQQQKENFINQYKESVEQARQDYQDGLITEEEYKAKVTQNYEGYIEPLNDEETKFLYTWGMNTPTPINSGTPSRGDGMFSEGVGIPTEGDALGDWRAGVVEEFESQIVNPLADTLWEGIGAESPEEFQRYMSETNQGQAQTYQDWKSGVDSNTTGTGGTPTDPNNPTGNPNVPPEQSFYDKLKNEVLEVGGRMVEFLLKLKAAKDSGEISINEYNKHLRDALVDNDLKNPPVDNGDGTTPPTGGDGTDPPTTGGDETDPPGTGDDTKPPIVPDPVPIPTPIPPTTWGGGGGGHDVINVPITVTDDPPGTGDGDDDTGTGAGTTPTDGTGGTGDGGTGTGDDGDGDGDGDGTGDGDGSGGAFQEQTKLTIPGEAFGFARSGSGAPQDVNAGFNYKPSGLAAAFTNTEPKKDSMLSYIYKGFDDIKPFKF